MTSRDPNEAIRASDLSTKLHVELRELAAQRLARATPGQTMQATDLVHEAWVKLRGDGTFVDRSRFFGAAARAMKDVLVDRVRRRTSQKRGGGTPDRELDSAVPQLVPAVPIDDLLSLDAVLDQLQRSFPDEAEVVLRRFFAGQTNAEVAADLGISESTVERRWRFARAWLARRLGDETSGTKAP